MGSRIFHDQRMNDSLETDSDTPLERDPEENRTNLATILQYLIRSGQVRIVTANSHQLYDDDSDDEICANISPPRVDRNPDTSCLKDSDICQAIKLNSGLLTDSYSNPSSSMNTLPSMLRLREVGMNGRLSFSHGDRCQIMQRVLPNKMDLMERYQGKVFCGSYGRNGDVFLSAAQDFCIRLYDTNNGHFKLKRTVEARDVGWSILDVVMSPDQSHFIYCSWSECIHICNLLGDPEVHEALPLFPEERRFCVFALRFSHDGHEIIGGANDECLYVYNREIRKRILKIRSHEDDVNSVAFADNTSQILYSAGDDGICKVWDRRTLCETQPKPVGILLGHEDGIVYIDSKGDGRHFITNSKDQTIKLWDMRAFSPLGCMESARKAVASNNWDYRWQRVPNSLHKAKRKLPGDTSLMTYRGHSVLQTLIRCHFSPEATTGQSYIYTGCAQGRVVIYDVLTGKIKRILRGHKGCVRDVSWHPYRNEIISSSWDGTVFKWTYKKAEIDSDSEDFMQTKEADTDAPSGLRRSQRLADQRRRQEAS